MTTSWCRTDTPKRLCKTTFIAQRPLPVIYVNDKRSRNRVPIVLFTRLGEANAIQVRIKISLSTPGIPPGTSFWAKNRAQTDNTTHMCWNTNTMRGPWDHLFTWRNACQSKPLTRHCDVMTALSACRNLIMTHSCSRLHLEPSQFGQERGQFAFKLPKWMENSHLDDGCEFRA